MASSPLAAQSATTGLVTGTVTASGRPIARALVTLATVGSETGIEVNTGTGGAFAFGFLPPGAYEIRVEAIGYRPLVARTIVLSAGETHTLSLELTTVTPPVLTVDTIVLAGATSARSRTASTRFGRTELNDLPYRLGDASDIASLSTTFGDSFEALGLPGGMTRTFVDGVPFFRAPHPTALGEQSPGAPFPIRSLQGVTAYDVASDIELSGGAGGYLSAASGPGLGPGPTLTFGYSGDPTWQSSELDIETPRLVSFEGGLGGTVTLDPSRSQLRLVGDVLRQQTPLSPRASASIAGDLADLDADLLGTLTEPAVESFSRYGGLVRWDLAQSRTTRVFLRGAGSFTRREVDGPDAVALAGGPPLAEESFDFSTAGGYFTETSETLGFELRGGVSGSYRDFGGAATAPPGAYLVDSGRSLGAPPSAFGSSSRTDVVLTPALRKTSATGTLKIGVSARAARHVMSHSPASLGDYAYADAAALLAGRGYGFVTSSEETSFTTREVGLFGQYDGTLGPKLSFSVAGRYDYERLGADGLTLNEGWEAATGIANTDVPSGFHQLGARGQLQWDPSASGRTRFSVVGSLHEGDMDPRAIHELLAESVDATAARSIGTGLSWPSDPADAPGASLPTLTLLGPDARPPRAYSMAVGIVQAVGSGLSLGARATFRRTDFIMRRRNLNLPLIASAADPQGRPIYGTLDKDGALVTATGDDARRFTSFGDVWALDPDGWSKYVGVTASAEYGGPSLDAYLSYTYSETTDNWVGARSSRRDAALPPGFPDASDGEPWSDGTSDFDTPHRAAAGVSLSVGRLALATVYRFRSGLPFTPGYRYGVDANGDGSLRNDPAFVPGDTQLAMLLDDWPCLEDQADAFATRNSCRGPAEHSLDARLGIDLGTIGGMDARLIIDGLDLIEMRGGVLDEAVLLVDPSAALTTSPDGNTVTIPTNVNPDFGTVLYPSTRGRMVRVSVRIGA